jgi:hypothetical protein
MEAGRGDTNPNCTKTDKVYEKRENDEKGTRRLTLSPVFMSWAWREEYRKYKRGNCRALIAAIDSHHGIQTFLRLTN